jgi:hypothetical protein
LPRPGSIAGWCRLQRFAFICASAWRRLLVDGRHRRSCIRPCAPSDPPASHCGAGGAGSRDKGSDRSQSAGHCASCTHCAARKPSKASGMRRCQPSARPACIGRPWRDRRKPGQAGSTATMSQVQSPASEQRAFNQRRGAPW